MKYDLKVSAMLYLVTDRIHKAGYDLANIVRDAIKGGVTMIQLRDKKISYEEFVYQARRIIKITSEAGIPCIINDNIVAAIAVSADGVHLGQNDLSVAEARKITNKDFIIGASANTVEEAIRAQDAGADYIGAGALFPTDTKKDTRSLSLETFSKICAATDIPVVGIGGIRQEYIERIMSCGATGIAVSSMILKADNIIKATEDSFKIIKGSAEKDFTD